jgi:erythromycin esterase
MKLLTHIILVVLYAFGTLPLCAYHSPADSENLQIKSQLVSLKSVEAGNSFEDLAPLKSIFADARVIALGEGTHGTREFFQFKHRMLEFLVNEMGCRCFAIEASYPDCLPINDYVLYGKGNRDEVLAGQGMWVWNTEEVADMIDWMRAYNQSVPEDKKVQFLGFDCQATKNAGKIVCELIQKGDPEFYEKAVTLLQPFQTYNFLWLAKEEEIHRFLQEIEEVSTRLNANSSHWKSSSEDYQHALFLLNLMKKDCEISIIGSKEQSGQGPLDRFLESHSELKPLVEEEGKKLLFKDEILAMYSTLQSAIDEYYQEQGLRDYYMAENVLSLLERLPSDARIMVWAHNFHMAKSNYKNFDRYIAPMGSHLQHRLGSGYYSLGFTTLKGTFQAFEFNVGRKVFSVPQQPQDSWAVFFSQFGIQNLMLDFRTLSSHEWFNQIHFLFHIGSCFSYEWGQEYHGLKEIPIEHFDGIVYIEETSSARPLQP